MGQRGKDGRLVGSFLISWRASDWDAGQIRFYALLSWIAWTVFCVLLLLEVDVKNIKGLS